MKSRKELFSKVKRAVVKVGTNVISSPKGRLDPNAIEGIADGVSELRSSKIEVIIVSSGAIGAGMSLLKLKRRPSTIPGEQATAAIGQSHLMRFYEEAFGRRGHLIAQVLLTQADLRDRRRYLNSRNTLLQLLSYGAIPIVNENDTVAVDELHFGERFGDNDTLSALVTNLIQADLLIILSDVDGLYAKDPRRGGSPRLIPEVRKITPEILEQAEGAGTPFSKGGMQTKLKAAKIVTSSGEMVVVANGGTPGVLRSLLEGEDLGTLFLPQGERRASRKRWIAHTLQPRGSIKVDDGAREALLSQGRSLLPSGVLGSEGDFELGDSVRVVDTKGREFARGITNYSSKELERIKGAKSSQIESVLGYKYHDEVIHRDNLVLL